MSQTTSITGGCACGAIRYEATAEPVVILNCHCRDCQRSSGGGYQTHFVVLKDSLRIVEGTPKFYGTPSENSGHTQRGFCPDCGSPLFTQPEAAPHIASVTAASLDDPARYIPQMDVWTCDTTAWTTLNPALTKFDKYPG